MSDVLNRIQSHVFNCPTCRSVAQCDALRRIIHNGVGTNDYDAYGYRFNPCNDDPFYDYDFCHSRYDDQYYDYDPYADDQLNRFDDYDLYDSRYDFSDFGWDVEDDEITDIVCKNTNKSRRHFVRKDKAVPVKKTTHVKKFKRASLRYLTEKRAFYILSTLDPLL